MVTDFPKSYSFLISPACLLLNRGQNRHLVSTNGWPVTPILANSVIGSALNLFVFYYQASYCQGGRRFLVPISGRLSPSPASDSAVSLGHWWSPRRREREGMYTVSCISKATYLPSSLLAEPDMEMQLSFYLHWRSPSPAQMSVRTIRVHPHRLVDIACRYVYAWKSSA